MTIQYRIELDLIDPITKTPTHAIYSGCNEHGMPQFAIHPNDEYFVFNSQKAASSLVFHKLEDDYYANIEIKPEEEEKSDR